MGAGYRVTASFEAFPGGTRLVTEWLPADRPPERVLLLLPPFAEELNKSRRTLAQSARAFARRGFVTCVADLKGTGDSEGDFGEARWSDWLDDLRHLAGALADRHGLAVTPWAVRSGALFLPELALPGADLLLWQPIVNGDAVLTQWLRMRVANDKLAGRESGGTRELRARLEAGETLEIAGYDLTPDLMLPMARVSLQAWAPGPRHATWIETGTEASGQPGPASERVIERWRQGGTSVEARWVPGDPFWLTQEITENLAMSAASFAPDGIQPA